MSTKELMIFLRKNKHWLLFFILLIAFILRMVYGYKLGLLPDEIKRLKVIEQFASDPSLILRGALTNHPMLSVYLTAFGWWVGRGSILFIRLLFVLLSIVGLVGIFRLAEVLFNTKIAFIALVLAALDHHLITLAPCFDERGFLFFVPWIILQLYKCTTTDQKRQWVLLGLLFGIGYNYNELVMLLAVPLIIFLILRRGLRNTLTALGPYLALFVCLVLILPNFISNLLHGSTNINYIGHRVSTIGITCRFFLLYLGELLVCFKNTIWIYMSAGRQMYMPFNIPCDWLIGLIHLICLVYAIRFFKDYRYSLLFMIIFGVALPASMVHPVESWNNFWYANSTLIPVIIITASVAQRLLQTRWAAAIAVSVLIYLHISVIGLLVGQKWRYTYLDWEKLYLSKMQYFETYGENAVSEARKLTDVIIRQHPKSIIAHYFRGEFASDERERAASFQKVIEMDPRNAMVHLDNVDALIRKGDLLQAKTTLLNLLSWGADYYIVRAMLANVEYGLHNYREAEKNALLLLKITPEKPSIYKLLFFIQDAMGKNQEAQESFKNFAARGFLKQCQAYLDVAKIFASRQEFNKARYYASIGVESGCQADSGILGILNEK